MSSQNNNHLYSSQRARVNTVFGDDGNWWELLRKAQLEYGGGGGDKADFQFWLTEHYGIRIYYDYDGILPNHDIVDEQKFLLFKLKYA
jgi:hypothetical protein